MGPRKPASPQKKSFSPDKRPGFRFYPTPSPVESQLFDAAPQEEKTLQEVSLGTELGLLPQAAE